MNFALLFIPSLLVVIFMKYRYSKDITGKELLIHMGICIVGALVALAVTYAVLYSKLSDVEIINGEVTGKYSHIEYCNSQSSSCKHYTWHERCTYSAPDSKGNRTRSCESYKVFDYLYEVDWYVVSTVGEFEIDRVNRQGTREPERYSIAKKGDPASSENLYINYLFADEYSLFATEPFDESYSDEYKSKIPDYPSVYDYYKVSHVVNTTNINVDGYDTFIANTLRTMGEKKQVNIVVVLYDYKDTDFVEATLRKWRGGKKNDVIMFFGVDSDATIKQFSSTSFAKGMKNEALHSKMRMDALNEKMTLDMVKIQVDNTNTLFNRLENKEFEYMKYKMEPKKEIIILISIILLVISIFVGLYMRDNDL